MPSFITGIRHEEEVVFALVLRHLVKLNSFAIQHCTGLGPGVGLYAMLGDTQLHHRLWQAIAQRWHGEVFFQCWLDRLECAVDWVKHSDFEQLVENLSRWLDEAEGALPSDRTRRIREANSLKSGAALVERHKLSAGVCRHTMADAVEAAAEFVLGARGTLRLSIDGNGITLSLDELTSGHPKHAMALAAFVIATIAERLHREVN